MIANHPDGRMMVKLLVPSKSDSNSEVQIQWSTRARSEPDDGEACAVCLARAPDCELRPCGHICCCRRCAVETVCTWRQEGPPRCVLCRAPFHAMVFLA